MATNKFATHCATCGAPVPPGAGVVTGDIGARAVTHVECPAPVALPPEHAKSFTVRSSGLVPDLLVLPDTHKSEQRRRVLGAVAALGVVALGGLGVLLFTGEDNEGTTRTTGTVQPAPTATTGASTVPPTSVPTQVAGVVEQRPSTTAVAVPVVTVPATEPPSTTAAPTTNEVPRGSTAPVTAPPSTSPSTSPPTAPTVPATVPPTVAPTVPPTTAAPATTVAPPPTKPPKTTTTKPPATTTTRRRGILGL